MEAFLVYFFAGLKLMFTLALLLGWILAWRYKSKGGGYLLWIIYCSCFAIALASILIFDAQFSRNDVIREWFMSDQGFIASLNDGRGLSFPAAQSISSFTGIHVVGMIFCIITSFVWMKFSKKKITS